MTVIQLISLYLLVGIINLAIIDWSNYKSTEMGNSERLTNWQKFFTFLFYPIFATTFWYHFFKAFFGNNDEG